MDKLPVHKNESNKQRAFQFISSLMDYDFNGSNTITDLKEWKLQNQVDVVLKTIEYLNAAQVQPQKIKVKEIAKFLDYCSYESNSALQLKWAALLANSLNESEKSISLLVFSEILNQLSENEINILEFLYDESFIESSEQKANLNKPIVTKHIGIDRMFGEVLFENLKRLNLIELKLLNKTTSTVSDPYFGEPPVKKDMEEFVSLSNLGQFFVRLINFEL